MSLFDHFDPFLKGIYHEKYYFMVIDLVKEEKNTILL
jgi:hypothetical protein